MAGGCDWSTLAVLKYVLDFLGPYAKNVKEVCSEWKKCKGLYSRLNFDHMFGMSSGEMHEKFCEIFKRTEVGGVRSLSFRECDFVDDLMLNGLMVYVNLEELNLSLCKNFTNVGLASVGRMRGIRKLKLIENKCVSGNVGCLVDLENLEDLLRFCGGAQGSPVSLPGPHRRAQGGAGAAPRSEVERPLRRDLRYHPLRSDEHLL